ncbi:alpha/beta hydrolase [Pseudooceanicola sediminis]|uniref:Palmitoyl-protein thioesterase ABHD10, mitochondrial n=1 Tax=Pseudooceanicola sediminis TaxID=2211117 RepID=A0A399J412_9RHOB|nr:alpha/beta hydrolase [Pseudooceanicola sediminis]KAA2314138.1 alpha/beta hydrolase [Puniceibacterium sp. HSS470]RII40001.1 alpha/beta hydrolase [Pseudooceanicola sediminis]
MADAQRIDTPRGRTLAYHLTPAAPQTQAGTSERPGVVFLGGFKSDMGGTKAVFLEEWCAAQGLAFLRFDYSGHGESSGAFVDGCIGNWAEDAEFAISHLTQGPQILVGSSMGGWISLLMTRRLCDRVAGLVTIAAAPDFTEDSMWAGFDQAQRQALEMVQQVALPSDYGEPYIITRRLIEDGRDHLVLRDPVPLPFPTRFLHGTADADVDLSVALRLMERATGDDIQLKLVKNADHRFSTPECLALIGVAIQEVLAAI